MPLEDMGHFFCAPTLQCSAFQGSRKQKVEWSQNSADGQSSWIERERERENTIIHSERRIYVYYDK